MNACLQRVYGLEQDKAHSEVTKIKGGPHPAAGRRGLPPSDFVDFGVNLQQEVVPPASTGF